MPPCKFPHFRLFLLELAYSAPDAPSSEFRTFLPFSECNTHLSEFPVSQNFRRPCPRFCFRLPCLPPFIYPVFLRVLVFSDTHLSEFPFIFIFRILPFHGLCFFRTCTPCEVPAYPEVPVVLLLLFPDIHHPPVDIFSISTLPASALSRHPQIHKTIFFLFS